MKRSGLTMKGEVNAIDREIIRLLSKGLLCKEIAPLVGRAESTIETYRTRLLKKVGARNACHLVAWGFMNGILSTQTK